MKHSKLLGGISLITVVILGAAFWLYDDSPLEWSVTIPDKALDFAYELDTWGGKS